MARVSRVVISILVTCFWTVIAQEEYAKYKDFNQPIGVRIKDLMSKVTLKEKIGQMTQIERSVASPHAMKKYFIGNKRKPFLFCTKTYKFDANCFTAKRE